MDGGVAVDGECLCGFKVQSAFFLFSPVLLQLFYDGTSYPLGPSSSSCPSTPEDVVGLDLVQDALGLGLALYLLDAADEDIELALEALAELLDCRDLLLSANNAGDGPRLLEQDWSYQLANLAVAAEYENVLAHDDVVVLLDMIYFCWPSYANWCSRWWQ